MIDKPFTQEQLDYLEKVYGLEKKESVLPVRDGLVAWKDKVWWRYENGPECVEACLHWKNIAEYPEHYQLKKPATKTEYID